jgi:hypothetical protein
MLAIAARKHCDPELDAPLDYDADGRTDFATRAYG